MRSDKCQASHDLGPTLVKGNVATYMSIFRNVTIIRTGGRELRTRMQSASSCAHQARRMSADTLPASLNGARRASDDVDRAIDG